MWMRSQIDRMECTADRGVNIVGVVFVGVHIIVEVSIILIIVEVTLRRPPGTARVSLN